MEELLGTWEQNKVAEKGRASVMDGVARELPGLSLAEKVIKKASAIDVDVPSAHADAAATAIRALVDAPDGPDDVMVGQALFALVARSRHAGIDPEMALRAETKRIIAAVKARERAG